MFRSFTPVADLTATRPNRIDITEKNHKNDGERPTGEQFDFFARRPDSRSAVQPGHLEVCQGGGEMPAPKRSAFLKLKPAGSKDDDD